MRESYKYDSVLSYTFKTTNTHMGDKKNVKGKTVFRLTRHYAPTSMYTFRAFAPSEGPIKPFSSIISKSRAARA